MTDKGGVRLALETSRRRAGFAMWQEGGARCVQLTKEQSQSADLIPMIREWLLDWSVKPSEVKELAIHVGPGSSTGLRMGVAFAQAWAMVYPKVIVHAVPLEALALELLKEREHTGPKAMLLSDAFAGQFFKQDYQFEDGTWKMSGDLDLMDKEALLQHSFAGIVIEELGRWKDRLPWPKAWQWLEVDFPTALQVLVASTEGSWVRDIKDLDVRYLKPTSAELMWNDRQRKKGESIAD